MYCKAPSALMVAFEEGHDDIVDIIVEHLYDKMKDAFKNNDDEVLKSVIGHLIAEIKYEADKLRENDDDLMTDLDLVVDFIAEVWMTLL